MNRIREEEIENILNNLNWNDSEDGADLSDAYSLTKSGYFPIQRGRRSVSIETRRALTMHLTRTVRTDGVGHSQIRANKRGRCKFLKCNGYSWVCSKCSKCNILLCNSKTKTCFNRYHNE